MVLGNVGCNVCGELPIIGARWKCAVCRDYGLCTGCYLNDQHSPEHPFTRFDAPGVEGIMVASKEQSQKESGYTFPEVTAAWFTATFGNTFLANVGRRPASRSVIEAVKCDSCGQQGIQGRRWKCAVCVNYDLCTNCHWGWKHCLDHAFLRIDKPGGIAILILPRSESTNGRTGGTSPEATKPRKSHDGGCAVQKEPPAKQRELLDALNCAICLEGRREVAFICGHTTCADCARKLSVCHMCRKTITKKITLY